MKWKNLKQNKCPKCDKAFGLPAFALKGYIQCSKGCGFIIREKRYSEIVNSQINAALEQKWDDEEESWMKGGE